MKVRGIDAVYYTADDLDKLTAFYTELLGAKPSLTLPGQIAEWIFDDGNSFGLYGAESKVIGGASSGSAMFAVDDVAGAVASAKSHGVTFHGDGAITETAVCFMAFGEDPEGNQFILHLAKET